MSENLEGASTMESAKCRGGEEGRGRIGEARRSTRPRKHTGLDHPGGGGRDLETYAAAFPAIDLMFVALPCRPRHRWGRKSALHHLCLCLHVVVNHWIPCS